MKNLVQVQKALAYGDHLGRDVFMYSISVTPDHDTPEVLKAYANKLGAKPGWTFLTGRAEDINDLRRKLGLSSLDPALRAKIGLPKLDKEADQKLHLGMIVIGYDSLNKKHKMSILSTPDQILLQINRMKSRGRPQK